MSNESSKTRDEISRIENDGCRLAHLSATQDLNKYFIEFFLFSPLIFELRVFRIIPFSFALNSVWMRKLRNNSDAAIKGMLASFSLMMLISFPVPLLRCQDTRTVETIKDCRRAFYISFLHEVSLYSDDDAKHLHQRFRIGFVFMLVLMCLGAPPPPSAGSQVLKCILSSIIMCICFIHSENALLSFAESQLTNPFSLRKHGEKTRAGNAGD